MRRFVGMFAFALWDRRERRLSLVRDRLGIKPLYYGWAGETLLFASELKAIVRASRIFAPRSTATHSTAFMRHDYVPSPLTIYEGFWKLPPGTMLHVDEGSRGGFACGLLVGAGRRPPGAERAPAGLTRRGRRSCSTRLLRER